MSQLPLKHKNYIICLFNLEYGGIQNGQYSVYRRFALQMSIIVLFEQIKSGDFRDKSEEISD
jgi:hypothetical protein